MKNKNWFKAKMKLLPFIATYASAEFTDDADSYGWKYIF